jgi:hypothetical protein
MQASTTESDGKAGKSDTIQLPVAFVGSSSSRNRSLDIFSVLSDLKLATEHIAPAEKEPRDKSKPKDTEKVKPPNQFKDKESSKTYVVNNRPSVIISITGDAQDLPDDHELHEGIEELLQFCQNGLVNGDELHSCFKVMSREDANRAILSNHMSNMKFEGVPSKCIQISRLLKKRIEDLNKKFIIQAQDGDKNRELLINNFKFPSFRDKVLSLNAEIDDLIAELKPEKNVFNFPAHVHTARGEGVDGAQQHAQHRPEPTTGGKRLSKAR